MKKYFIFADIHGFYNLLKSKLDEVGFDINNEDHVFVSCGDLLDRGGEPLQCLQFVNNLPKDRKVLIRGNHEDLLDEAIERGIFLYHDNHNGTVSTVMRLTNNYDINNCLGDMVFQKDYNEYRDSLVDFDEIGDYVFVHGWVPTHNCKPTEPNWRYGDWSEARWLNGMDFWNKGSRIEGKTIVCGHWHTSWGHKNLRNFDISEYGDDANFEPFIDEGIIALDACTAYSGKMNCMVLDIDDTEHEMLMKGESVCP